MASYPRHAPRVGTLSDLVAQRRSLVLYCTRYRCGGSKIVDIEAVIREHGDMALQAFAERSRCLKCGAYEPQTVCSPIDTGPMSRAT